MVLSGTDVTEEQADRIYERELKLVSRKFTHMRYHLFLMYFGMLKRLGWVEVTQETEDSELVTGFNARPDETVVSLVRSRWIVILNG